MLLKLTNISVSIFEQNPVKVLARVCKLKPADFKRVELIRRNIDARNHRNINYICTYHVELADGIRKPAGATIVEELAAPEPVKTTKSYKPVIIGAGPAGLFAALAFAESGIECQLIEQGKPVGERQQDIKKFWDNGVLDTSSNMYYGEGGAGTFSDGKLNTRTSLPENKHILQQLINAGAPQEILYDAKPHLGTDCLIKLLPALRKHLTEMGVTFRFQTRLDDIAYRNNRLEVCLNGDWQEANPLVLGIGHSSIPTYRMLHKAGVALELKDNAFGFRIEHPSDFITERFYGKSAKVIAALGNAGYNLNTKVTDGSVYSFCCCPGGEIVSCSATDGLISANGMSYSKRDGQWTNAGFVTNIKVREFVKTPAEMLDWREELERNCFINGGSDFSLPVQTAKDFLDNKISSKLPELSCPGKTTPGNLHNILPEKVTAKLQQGLLGFNKKIKGWINNGNLVGVETTTSSPVRISRNEIFESLTHPGLLPVGEGSGYAGGIMTSAMDGYRAVRGWLTNKEL